MNQQLSMIVPLLGMAQHMGITSHGTAWAIQSESQWLTAGHLWANQGRVEGGVLLPFILSYPKTFFRQSSGHPSGSPLGNLLHSPLTLQILSGQPVGTTVRGQWLDGLVEPLRVSKDIQ
jgi:hypothetical protein